MDSRKCPQPSLNLRSQARPRKPFLKGFTPPDMIPLSGDPRTTGFLVSIKMYKYIFGSGIDLEMTPSEMFSQIYGGIIASKSAHKYFRVISPEQEAIILYSPQNLEPHSLPNGCLVHSHVQRGCEREAVGSVCTWR